MMRDLIHIVDPFDVPWSGSALEALELYDLLCTHANVRLWAHGVPHDFYKDRPIVAISPTNCPAGGTLIIVGAYYEPRQWLESSHFSRVIIKYNSISHVMLFRLVSRLRQTNLPEPSFVFPSQFLKNTIGLPGLVEPSPISLSTFTPSTERHQRPYTIGRHSRDILYKYSEDDPSLCRMLALQGHQVRIMGGTCLSPYMKTTTPNIELLPAGIQPAADFLRSLDCFIYRTLPGWFETFGRVVLEAMACGLPVVCERNGGYVECIQHGKNGFLFDTQEEAWESLQRLSKDAELRAEIGREARKTTEEIYHSKHQARYRAWYLENTTAE